MKLIILLTVFALCFISIEGQSQTDDVFQSTAEMVSMSISGGSCESIPGTITVVSKLTITTGSSVVGVESLVRSGLSLYFDLCLENVNVVLATKKRQSSSYSFDVTLTSLTEAQKDNVVGVLSDSTSAGASALATSLGNVIGSSVSLDSSSVESVTDAPVEPEANIVGLIVTFVIVGIILIVLVVVVVILLLTGAFSTVGSASTTGGKPQVTNGAAEGMSDISSGSVTSDLSHSSTSTYASSSDSGSYTASIGDTTTNEGETTTQNSTSESSEYSTSYSSSYSSSY